MVNWHSQEEILRDYDVFIKLVFTLFGVTLWEIFLTLDFEWSLIVGRRKFRWPLVCSKMLYIFNSWAGNMTILCASTSLMLRTMALWERAWKVIVPLSLLCLAHWGLLWRTMFIVIAQWDDIQKTCVVTSANPGLLTSTFFFTMAFDGIILVYTLVALCKKHSTKTDLWKLLKRDGLIYFVISFTTNCIPAVFNVLNLNTPMNVPAAAISSIVACRAVIRLLDFNPTQDVFTFKPPSGNSRSCDLGMSVHITTEHITLSELPR
ncbi:hypothetical protein DL96DRAFT_1668218 [Flagelloscypha sp. PMI_526]|nr:hypothetical protein DL96DRAFT_1668218 [Flagelloscypha sp. PMI_526]